MADRRDNLIWYQMQLWNKESVYFYYNDDNIPLVRDLSDYYVTLCVKEEVDDDELVIKLSEGNRRIVNDGSTGKITMSLSAAETSSLSFDNAEYTLYLVPCTETDIAFGGSYSALAIDKSAGTLTANGGSPFTAIRTELATYGQAIIVLSGCEDSDNDGLYEVISVTDSDKVITVANSLEQGYCADMLTSNVSDTAATITILNRDADNIIWGAYGSVSLRKRTTCSDS